MNRKLVGIGIPFLGSALVSCALFACSSDDDDGTPAAMGGSAGTAGLPGAGGDMVGAGGTPVGMGGTPVGMGGAPAGMGGMDTSAGGMMPAAGGEMGMGGETFDPESLYVCEKRAPQDPGGMVADGEACCGGKGTCGAPTGSDAAVLGHETCGTASLCSPSAETSAAFTTCRAMQITSDPAGLEGRCVPKCFLLGTKGLPTLNAGTCMGTDEICAPCYDPVTGTDSGVCSFKADDAPADPAPTPYVSCPMNDGGPSGGGLCVPETAVAPFLDEANAYYNPSIPGLKKDNCAEGEKCVPEAKALDPGACFTRCTTSDQTVAIAGGDTTFKYGTCTPEYVIFDVAGQSGILISTGGEGCTAEGDLCAPCKDPLKSGAPSGSCY